MKKQLLSLVTATLLYSGANAQQVLQSFPFQHYWDVSVGAAPDPLGNVFIAGELFNFARTNTGFDLIRKIDSNGSIIWPSSQTANSYSQVSKITSDPWGNCYVLGSFSTSMQFESGPVLTTSAPGMYAWYLAKFNGVGAVIWMQKIEIHYGFTGHNIACDASGNVIISGYEGYSTSPGTTPAISFSPALTINARAFVAKYSTAGTLVWATGINANIKGLDKFASGEVAIAGDLVGPLTIGNTNYPTYAAGTFVAKLNTDGEAIWAERVASSGKLIAVATDPSGNLLATGEQTGQATLFVAKYTPSGSQEWVKAWPNAGGYFNNVKHLVTDTNGNCIFTGDFVENFTFQGQSFVPSGPAGGYDAYLICLNPAGNYMWGLQAGDQSIYTSDEKATHLSIDNQNNLYFTGILPYYYGPVVREMNFGGYQSMEIGSFLYKVKTSTINAIYPALQEQLQVYPNPNKGNFVVQLQNAQEQSVKAELRNVLGQVVWQQNLAVENGNVLLHITTSNLSKGIYYIQVSTGKGTAVQKVVIE